MQEKTIQTKKCKHCNSAFEITDKDLEFYNKISPIFDWKKYQIPTPTLCPDCRQQRRLSFRNERNLYRRDCDATGKTIISMYSPDKKVKVYSQEEWWSDNWDSLDYWIDFDFSKWFFEQFWKLFRKVPMLSLSISSSDNCSYNNLLWESKNCYYTFASWYIEDSYYSHWIWWSEKIYDSFNVIKSNNLYESISVINCSNSIFLNKCDNCHNSVYLKDCVWCTDCFSCVWLINKKYFIWNKKYSKEKYLDIKKCITKLELFKIYKKVYEDSFFKNLSNINCENVTWDELKNSKNLRNCYNLELCNDCENILWWFELKSSLDIDYHNNAELIYELISWAFVKKASFSVYCSESDNLYYCISCFSSSYLFWCIWLKHKKYCILNKQYTKEQYNKLVPKIIENMQKTWEWWEFFPSSISPFWYNETVAQEYFPLTKEEAKHKWFNWSDYEPPKPNVEKIIPAEKLPENIKEIPDDILNWAIKCEVTQKPFRIIKQELEFYRKHNLPIPRKHPDQRHLERMALRNPRKLFDRKCDKCWIVMKTTYSPNREEIVYCEKCYEKEIY